MSTDLNDIKLYQLPISILIIPSLITLGAEKLSFVTNERKKTRTNLNQNYAKNQKNLPKNPAKPENFPL